jgi:hypothetical protein
MYKPSTYLVTIYFPTYLPIYETYMNWGGHCLASKSIIGSFKKQSTDQLVVGRVGNIRVSMGAQFCVILIKNTWKPAKNQKKYEPVILFLFSNFWCYLINCYRTNIRDVKIFFFPIFLFEIWRFFFIIKEYCDRIYYSLVLVFIFTFRKFFHTIKKNAYMNLVTIL